MPRSSTYGSSWPGQAWAGDGFLRRFLWRRRGRSRHEIETHAVQSRRAPAALVRPDGDDILSGRGGSRGASRTSSSSFSSGSPSGDRFEALSPPAPPSNSQMDRPQSPVATRTHSFSEAQRKVARPLGREEDPSHISRRPCAGSRTRTQGGPAAPHRANARQRSMSRGRIPACTWHSPSQIWSGGPVTFSKSPGTYPGGRGFRGPPGSLG